MTLTEPPPDGWGEPYARDSLPTDPDQWPRFTKTGTTAMTRIDGPFQVRTREGLERCPDGWLALDVNGDPYPIAADVQAATYAAVVGDADA